VGLSSKIREPSRCKGTSTIREKKTACYVEKLVRDCRPPLSLRGLWPEPVDRQDSRHPFPHTGFRSLVPENFPSRDLPGALRAGHPGPVEKRAGRRPFSIPHPEPLNTGSLVPESSLAGARISTARRLPTTCLDYSNPVCIFTA